MPQARTCLQYSRHDVGRNWMRVMAWGWTRKGKSKIPLKANIKEASVSVDGYYNDIIHLHMYMHMVYAQ